MLIFLSTFGMIDFPLDKIRCYKILVFHFSPRGSNSNSHWCTMDYGILRAAKDSLVVSSISGNKRAAASLPHIQESLKCDRVGLLC